MAISKFTPLNAKKDTGRTIGDNEVAKLANLNRMVDQVNNEFANLFNGSENELLAADGSVVTAGSGIEISNGQISSIGGGGTVLPTFTYTTLSGYNKANIIFNSYLISGMNFGGIIISGYTKTGTLNLNSNTNQLTSFTSDVEITTNINIDCTNFIANSLSFSNLVALDTNLTINFVNTSHRIIDAFPSLQAVGQALTIGNSAALIDCTFPSLQFVGTGLNINGCTNSALTSINLPNLQQLYGTFTLNGNTFVTNVNLNLLEIANGSMNISSMTNLVSLNLPSLKILGLSNSNNAFTVTNATNLTTINLQSIERIYTSGTNAILCNSGNPALTNFTFGPNLKQIGTTTQGNVNFQGCALNQTSVDNILVSLSLLDGTNGTTTFNNRTVTLNGGTNSTPSATGLAAKAVLQSRGCTVNTN